MWQDDEFDANKILIVFGENIRRARIKNNMSLAALAKLANYDRVCLSKLEEGKQNVEFRTSVKLARVLNVSYRDLFSRNFVEEVLESNKNFSVKFQEDEYLLVFIENFQRCLHKDNKLQIQVYLETGVSESMVSRIINGINKNPTLKTLYAMAYTVGSDINNLFSRISKEDNL